MKDLKRYEVTAMLIDERHKDGVYHCQMHQCPYRASFYCMVTCKGVKKTEEKKKEL